MVKKTMDVVVNKRLKCHKAEVALLWLIIAMAAIPIPTGIGIYLYVNNLSITQYVLAIPTGNFAISQVRMLCNFAKALGVVFSLTGIAVIILALDRLSFTKAAYRMASFIRKGES